MQETLEGGWENPWKGLERCQGEWVDFVSGENHRKKRVRGQIRCACVR